MSVEGPNAAKTQGRYLRADGDGFFVSLVGCQIYYNFRVASNRQILSSGICAICRTIFTRALFGNDPTCKYAQQVADFALFSTYLWADTEVGDAFSFDLAGM